LTKVYTFFNIRREALKQYGKFPAYMILYSRRFPQGVIEMARKISKQEIDEYITEIVDRVVPVISPEKICFSVSVPQIFFCYFKK